jgi:ABC-type Fe3+/spermidine/putrescine transport system ATPase subunit
VRQPKLLLLDEPLGALDKRLREAMQIELRTIQRKVGITFLLVTHDQEEALSLAEHIAVMSGGRILQIASPRELYERPNCREVADFIGEINFFHASVKEIGEAGVIVNAGLLGIITLPRGNVAAGARAGDHILLAIRPEHIRLAPQGVAGEIVTSTFLGERSHFHVKIAGRSEPVAVSGSPPNNQVPPGNAVMLAFPPENLIGLPAGD